ncbi:MAG: hypothetical protein U9M98_03930 [Patescibacteria group bacterium]|nr:hypothetical protein [Patescibacteria group bacterium]
MELFSFLKKRLIIDCKEEGQSLVEIIVSVGLVFVAVAALLALVAMSMRGSGFGTTKARAAKLSNEHMERIRAYRDTVGWAAFFEEMTDNCMGQPCYLSENLSLNSGGVGTSNPFGYYFQVEQIAGATDRLRILVNVNWGEHGSDRNISAKAILTDWR